MVCSLEKGRKVLKNGVSAFTEIYKAIVVLILYESTTLFKICSNFVQNSSKEIIALQLLFLLISNNIPGNCHQKAAISPIYKDIGI